MIQVYSDEDRRKLLIQMIDNESLFRFMDEFFDIIDKNMKRHTSRVENWYDSKEFVAQLFKCSHPEMMIWTMLDSLKKNCENFSSCERNGNFLGSDFIYECRGEEFSRELCSVLLCVYMILIYLLETGNHTVQAIQQKIFDYVSQYNSLGDVMESIRNGIHTGVTKGMIEADYDYIHNKPNIVDQSGAALCDENIDLDDEDLEVVTPQLRVRIEFLLRLLNIDCVEKYDGNIRALSRLLGYILNVKPGTLRSTMINKDPNTRASFKLNERQHGEDIKKLNSLLLETGIDSSFFISMPK